MSLAIGSVADPAASGPTVDATAIALLKAILTALGGTITVTGGLTDAQLRATAVPISAALGGISLPTALVHGQKTVAAAGTEEALGASATLYSGVRIKALHGNTGWVYVGANPVTSGTGLVLDAGEEVFLEVANLATVYIDVSVNGEGVSYIGG